MKLQNGKPISIAREEAGPDRNLSGSSLDIKAACNRFLARRGMLENYQMKFGRNGRKAK
jgi:hypothetical protein